MLCLFVATSYSFLYFFVSRNKFLNGIVVNGFADDLVFMVQDENITIPRNLQSALNLVPKLMKSLTVSDDVG